MESTIVTKAICLSFTEYKEYDRLVRLFSVDLGVITATVKGIKKATAKLRMSSETFCLAEYTLIRKKDFYQVIGANIIDSFFSIVNSYELFTLSNALLESTQKALAENIPYAKVFINLLKSLKAICYEKRHSVYVVCHYMSYLLDFLGYKINFDYCSNCNKKLEGKVYFDFDKGGFLCSECNTYGQIVDTEFIRFLKIVCRTPLAQSDEIGFEELDLRPVLNFICINLEKKIEKKINSVNNYLDYIKSFR